MKGLKYVLVAILLVFIGGCAATMPVKEAYGPYQKMHGGEYEPRVDNFLIVLDNSASLGESHKKVKKSEIAKEVVSGINETLPDLSLNGGFRIFGRGAKDHNTDILYGMTPHKTTELQSIVNGLKSADGMSPMGEALAAAKNDLKDTSGKIALILVADGQETTNTSLAAAKALKGQYKERVCIYTIQVGDDKAGKVLLDQLVDIGECGFSVNADDIATDSAMTDYVKRVFLTEIMDSDGDGISDQLDKCPDTPRGAPVDRTGCLRDSDGDGLSDWDETQKYGTDPNNPDSDGDGLNDGDEVMRYKTNPLNPDTDGDGLKDGEEVLTRRTNPKDPDTDDGGVNDGLEVNVAGSDPLDPADDVKEVKRIALEVLFATNSDKVGAAYYKEIEGAANFMKSNPGVICVIEGHTDSLGAEDYNLGLSKRRANAVREILIENYGIESSRISAEGYGGSRPVATNATSEGRAKNRRINAVFKAR